MQVADLLLPPKEKKSDNALSVADSNLLKKWVGRYVSSRGNILNLYWHNGKLVNRQPGQTTGGTEWKLAVKAVIVANINGKSIGYLFPVVQNSLRVHFLQKIFTANLSMLIIH